MICEERDCHIRPGKLGACCRVDCLIERQNTRILAPTDASLQ